MSTADSKANKVLSKMLDRLFAGLLSGPGMNCRPHNSRQRVDLVQLAKLQDLSPEQVLQQLLGPNRQAKVIASVKPARKTAGDEIDPEPSPRERAWEDQTALLNKLRLVADDARTYEQDTGVHVLNVGFPLLSLPPGSFNSGPRNSTKRVLAPIAFIPVTLAMKRGTSPTIELACRGEGVDLVMPNTALLAWLEQQTGNVHGGEIFADEEGENPWREIVDLVAHVANALHLPVPPEFAPPAPVPAPVPITALAPAPAPSALPQAVPDPTSSAESRPTDAPAVEQPAAAPVPPSFQLQPAPRTDTDTESPAILCAAVLGLFPMANQGLLRDTQAMLAQSADTAAPRLTGPVESFLNADVDFDDVPAPLFDNQPTPPQRTARKIQTERLAAAADPCQARAVSLARDSRGLVVHGPPGTGKSQTITNIIADHLSRGQRVLLVCEKRTALDVVADRLEHMGLRSLCGIVHDPQRDQRDLYKSIRQQLEDLPELKTNPRAEEQLAQVDSELQKLHDELTRHHQSLMAANQKGGLSFHELMGQWMAIRPDTDVRINELAAHAISPEELNARQGDLLDLLRRAASVDFERNPWAKCAGIALGEFLGRPMGTVRTALERCRAAASAADQTLDPAIPPFSSKAPLNLQGHARAEIAERLKALLQKISPVALARWIGQDEDNLRSARQKLSAAEGAMQVFRSGALDTDLRTAVDPLPSPAEITPQLVTLDSYLQIAGKWYAFLSFGTRSLAQKLLRRYGLPLTATEAERLKKFLVGLRARLAIQQVRTELSGETAGPLPADDVLERFFTNHAELFDLMLRLHEDPELSGLSPLAVQALAKPETAAVFIDGLRKSSPRAQSLTHLEEELPTAGLFDPAWLAAFTLKLRNNQPALETISALVERADTVEGILRVRQSRLTLPGAFDPLVDDLLRQSFEPEVAVGSLRKSVLAGEILRRLRNDPQLQAIDAHRIESNFARYRTLDTEKKQLVRDSILHRWISRQKERLLAGAGLRLNSTGADLRRRLTLRGERAMRLRQVISVGEKIEGGDPLFDLCPVWMASPETVAQVFPRKCVFDVIVFDEASQCRLEEALPVLTRGQRVVVAGDPRQLPPTRFFESAFTQGQEEEPENEQELFESQQGEVEDLLGAALNLSIQQCYLDVHYRSRNADLIEFSNENFYSSRLQAIPAHPSRREKQSPITLHKVDGLYSNRRNEAEAQRVVEIVQKLLEGEQTPSIGIACFNLQQRDLIVEKLDDLAGEKPEFSKKLTMARARRGQGSFEGLFVKNLENVQGDERDHIIISTTYGPDSRGKFYRRFGPLGRTGGGRRLNVLVTRAREHVHMVTSIPADSYRNLPAIPPGQTAGGGWLLFAYLKFAEDLAGSYAARGNGDAAALADAKPPAVSVHPSKSPSLFAEKFAQSLALDQHVGSDVHWGNDGFCVDVALHSCEHPNDVTVGVLCDSCRYSAADDPVEWDIFRTGILAGQGWKLKRIWTPHFFRDPVGGTTAVMETPITRQIPEAQG